ncbi:hypothetical protein DITRI_Ditri19aG0037100 [Diplodiscus trichospermus]
MIVSQISRRRYFDSNAKGDLPLRDEGVNKEIQMPKEICPVVDQSLHWRKLPKEISNRSDKGGDLPDVLYEGQSEVPSTKGDPDRKSCK